jgi:uncharacterized membrane-anchored protein
MTEKEKNKLINWIEENNNYSLLWDENFTDQQLIETKKTIEEIDKILEEAAEKIKKLGKTTIGKKLGIGDTATDEDIVGELYSAIH